MEFIFDIWQMEFRQIVARRTGAEKEEERISTRKTG
jgi:hypothetical protein